MKYSLFIMQVVTNVPTRLTPDEARVVIMFTLKHYVPFYSHPLTIHVGRNGIS